MKTWIVSSLGWGNYSREETIHRNTVISKCWQIWCFETFFVDVEIYEWISQFSCNVWHVLQKKFADNYKAWNWSFQWWTKPLLKHWMLLKPLPRDLADLKKVEVEKLMPANFWALSVQWSLQVVLCQIFSIWRNFCIFSANQREFAQFLALVSCCKLEDGFGKKQYVDGAEFMVLCQVVFMDQINYLRNQYLGI